MTLQSKRIAFSRLLKTTFHVFSTQKRTKSKLEDASIIPSLQHCLQRRTDCVVVLLLYCSWDTDLMWRLGWSQRHGPSEKFLSFKNIVSTGLLAYCKVRLPCLVHVSVEGCNLQSLDDSTKKESILHIWEWEQFTFHSKFWGRSPVGFWSRRVKIRPIPGELIQDTIRLYCHLSGGAGPILVLWDQSIVHAR